ncbi:hypothetical protein [Bacillus phage CP-51]|uniref:Uncharacterized protein n=1 Tax=Bacillus phage CP-51 TaxID=1391188 RepID=A0A068EUB5_9CAUD|nr:hypothetical protein OZ73_gp196 [Bacillus phage CP-51]AID50631.1 hypothetical protein [Bacillus phage CP-51]
MRVVMVLFGLFLIIFGMWATIDSAYEKGYNDGRAHMFNVLGEHYHFVEKK